MRLCAPTVGLTPAGSPEMLSATGAVNVATFDTVMVVCNVAPGAAVNELGLIAMPMSEVTTTSVVAVLTRPPSVAVAVSVKLPAALLVAAFRPIRKTPAEFAPTEAVTPAGSPETATTGFGVTPTPATLRLTAAVPAIGRITRLVANVAVKSPATSVVGVPAWLPIVVDPSDLTSPPVVVEVVDVDDVVVELGSAAATVVGPPTGGTVSSSFAGVSPSPVPGVRYASLMTSVNTVRAFREPLVPLNVIR